MKKKIILLIITANICVGLFATTRYVSPSGSNTSPYTSLATAATNIQSAVNVSSDGDIVLIDDGSYLLTTHIYVIKGITVKSINGAASVILDMQNNTGKCLYINHANAIVDGLTLQNANNPGQFGGGAQIAYGGTLQNCIIQNNQARDGGGVAMDYGGLVQNCIIKNNLASDNGSSGYGGGIRILNAGEARNCLITENTSIKYGGGINIWNAGTVINCTITKNKAPYGGGIRTRNNSIVKNTIIYFNTLMDGSTLDNYNLSGGGYHYYNSCTSPALSATYSTNCISSIPLFVDLSSGSENYHLKSGSSCIDAGLNLGWMGTTLDLDRNARIYNAIVDMGCYEYNTPTIIDDDGDGIANVDDDFPNDPDKAFLNYFPAAGFGSLAYEDLWPAMGDYDFNDVIVDYRFATVTNAQDYIVDITGTFVAKATGAFYHNGFGFELTSANNALKSDMVVTGSDIQESYILVDANGLEENQDHPTIIVFDDIFNSLPHPGIGIGVNTEDGTPFVPFDTITVVITPTQNTYAANDFNLISWNPFIIINANRAMEVHLKDKPPTSLADQNQFGTMDDNSDPGSNRYYVNANNLPWAIDIPSSYEWPKEKIDITRAHLRFREWAVSLGSVYDDWYLDNIGYRDDNYIYQIPTP